MRPAIQFDARTDMAYVGRVLSQPTPPAMEPVVEWAAALAEQHLSQLGPRWLHTSAVAGRASLAASTIEQGDRGLLIAAAWLHDLGYAPEIAESGFHPLDGARYLQSLAAPPRLVNLVANHSCAWLEADVRYLRSQLDAFTAEIGLVSDALIFADMTAGPTGRTVTVEERLSEILHRYKPGDPVHRAMDNASGEIKAAVSRVEQRLAQML